MFDYSCCDLCPLPESACDGCPARASERRFSAQIAAQEPDGDALLRDILDILEPDELDDW